MSSARSSHRERSMVVAHSALWASAHGPEDGDDGGDGIGDPPEEPGRKTNLQQLIQAVFDLLPQDHILKEVVRLEFAHRIRVRYLAVAAATSPRNDRNEESCLLGFDCAPDRIQGLVLFLYADSWLTQDGDGGVNIVLGGTKHLFEPVPVHVSLAVYQSYNKACARAQKFNHFPGGTTHRWVESYRITSDLSCLNEWHYLTDVESRRRSSNPLMTSSSSTPDEKADRERLIRSTSKEVMMTLDLDVNMSCMEKTEARSITGIELTGSPLLIIYPPDEESFPFECGECRGRPTSWSPDESLAKFLFPSAHQETGDTTGYQHWETEANCAVSVSLRVSFSDGQTYRASQNRAVKLVSSPPPPPPPCFALEMDPAPSVLVECVNTALLSEEHQGSLWLISLPRVGSVKGRICELEAAAATTMSTTPPNWLGSTSQTNLVHHLEPSDTSTFILDSDGLVLSSVISALAIFAPSAIYRERQPDQRYKSTDVFSVKVDRVFELEVRRQSNRSTHRDPPHRQHSLGDGVRRNIRSEHHPSLVPTPPVVINFKVVNCWMPSCYSSDLKISTEAATVPVISGRPHLLTKTPSLLIIALFDLKIIIVYIILLPCLFLCVVIYKL